MRFFFADYETHWNRKTKHSLTHMNPVEYVMHPATEIQVLTYAFDRTPVECLIGEAEIQAFLSRQDWSDTMIVSHNGNLFDHMITRWRFGVDPFMWGDTLAMARPIHGTTVGGSLDKLTTALKLGKKGSLEATSTEGTYTTDWTPDMRAAISAYAVQDTVLLRRLFMALLPDTPVEELRLIDLTARMVVDPGFEVDDVLLSNSLAIEANRKAKAIYDLGVILGYDDPELVQKTLMSNPQFSFLLSQLGVETPKKVSPTTGKETYALAKTDPEFLALLDHDDARVAAAAEARLGTKSSILESRLKTFRLMAAYQPQGRMPIGLTYWGASTGRWSGALSANQQNLPRIPRDKQGNIIPKTSNALRLCLLAPEGHSVVVADLSGIELRVNHFLWKVPSSMELYAQDPEADLYKAFASYLYEVPAEIVTKDQRQFAKLCQLGLGYGMSAAKFRTTAKLQGVDLTPEAAVEAVDKWRAMYAPIVDGWRKCGDALPSLAVGADFEIDPWNLCTLRTNQPGILHTPGSCLRYPDLRREADAESGKRNWVYGEGRGKRKIYSSLLDENIVQHLARNVIAHHALQIAQRYPIHHMVHDEIVCVVPDEQAQPCLDFMLATMKTPPPWWPEIVLFAEGDIAKSYGAAK